MSRMGLVFLLLIAGGVAGVGIAQAQSQASCRFDGAGVTHPPQMALGNPASVRLDVYARCSHRQVVIGFGTRADDRPDDLMGWMRDAIAPWLRRVDLEHLELAFVTSKPGRTVQPLTSDRAALLAGLTRGANPRFAGSYEEAIKAARQELLGARTATVPDQAMLIAGDVLWVGHGLIAKREADMAKEAGIEIYIVCADTIFAHVDPAPLASGPGHVFRWRSPVDYHQREREVQRVVTQGLNAVENSVVLRGFQSVSITTTLPSSFAYVADSAEPPASWDPAQRTLSWSFASPPITTTVTYDATPLECGTHDLPSDSWATGIDLEGKTYRHDYTPVEVEVPCPTVTPTVTPTATVTPTMFRVTPQGPVPVSIYLPVALHEAPCSEVRRAAIAVVIDTSSSMLERTDSGRTKIEVAVEAAGAFIGVLTFPQDQAAVIGFDSDVEAHELTSDPDTLREQLARLESEPGTKIHLGVEAAHTELISVRRRPDNFPAMVVLTDGQASEGPQLSIAAADAAKADGVYVFTIGLGNTIDREQLRAIASEPEWFYEAATAEDLEAVYAAIAVDLPCPADRYWGRR